MALPGAAQAQREREWRVQALGTVAPAAEAFVGGGLGLILRARSRLGFGLTAALGTRDGNLAGRGEVFLSFVLDPFRQRGVAPYAAGGVAVVSDRIATSEYLVATLGLAANPARRTGWFVEAGVGGGLRLAVGLALRRRTG
ncbi:MAG: hypothetical protein HYW06_05890 [Gemmatimonadetes bacterium]|nr:hypothetical protein [Gemmatimonadota bacterium]MBI2536486.1 hypothetical protein [Gemmatimonadota bacterium]